MKSINWNKQQEIVCAHLNVWGVYVSGLYQNDSTPDSDIDILYKLRDFVFKEIEFRFTNTYEQQSIRYAICCDEFIIFDTEKEARKFYEIFELAEVDSGPIYACLYSPTKGCVTENT